MKGSNSDEVIKAEKKKGWCQFADQLLSNRFKQFQKKELVFEAI